MKMILMASVASLALVGCGGGTPSSGGTGGGTSQDTTAPVITLLGSADMSTPLHEAYVEPGATAHDNVDGDITDRIVINNSVDTSVAATYSLLYSVVDNAGNYAEVERKVNVTPDLSNVETVITLAFIASQETLDYYGDDLATKTDHLVATTNTYYANSDISVRFDIVGGTVDDTGNTVNEGDIFDVKFNLEVDEPVHEYADSINADLIVGLTLEAKDSGVCGVATLGYVDDSNKLIFSFDRYVKNEETGEQEVKAVYNNTIVVRSICSSETLAHEIGHTFGNTHSEEQDGANNASTVAQYARGYGIKGSFSTVMTYPSAFNLHNPVPMFSDPNKDFEGTPIGVEEGLPHEAFAVKVIRDHKDDVAAWR